MKIFKTFAFEAAHQLPPEREDIYGKCSRQHGHSYRLKVTAEGPVNEQEGWVMNFSTISEIVDRRVIDVCDHQNLNEIYPGMITTAENLAMIWAREISQGIEEVSETTRLAALEVWETAKCGVLLDREDIEQLTKAA